MWERFPAVSERVQQVYGLRLPRHLAVFCALWKSADSAERQALGHLGVGPFGVSDYFGDDGLRLVGRDGLDERLHGRFRCDPAEFVTVMTGGSDGLHYGLWYDDPAELPSFVAHNYARDSAETWTNHFPALIMELRDIVSMAMSDYGDSGEEAEILQPLVAALEWFAPAEYQALETDGKPRWASAARPSGFPSIFPALPPDSGDPHSSQSSSRLSAFRNGTPEAAEWITRAEQELAAGRPALALAVGGELHWMDRDDHRQQSRRLLVDAYRLLGRDALADLVEVHTAHRDLRSVDVLVKPDH
ncbi:ADP-ribosylation family protein [Actinocorallia populi]|uniref:ADP-ribosylation family protein n=1 Tax=Actinocorallia populi TaxID=2079200 RepID=UPI0013009BB9|nr:ADP-ribosylation family protein [Actinocorallia populi]